MAKKLKDDHIRWILDVDAKGAQGEIQKMSSITVQLTQENKKLAAEIKEVNSEISKGEREMQRLEKANKTGTRAYKELSMSVETAKNEVSDYSQKILQNEKAIKDNGKAVDKLIKSLKVEEMTFAQLKRRAFELQQQLNNTAKATSPESYSKLEKELKDVRERMGELGDVSQKTGGILKTTIGVALGIGLAKGVQALGSFVGKAKDFVKEGVEMAAAAQGIETAFNRFANKDYLQSLRKSTKGLVNDLELMKAAVRAENFNIPLDQLGKLLAFAQQRAQDTGESVEYLTNSIVDGIGRKSPMILDNLGISTSKLNTEIKKTGDFATAVGNIVEEEMSKVGESIDTAADVATRKTVALENLQLALGKRFVGLKSFWDNMVTDITEGLAKLIEVEKSQTEQYNDQIEKVADLEVNTTELVRRYDELKSKTELSKDEQIELNKVISSLRISVPGIATEFDKYGNVISINTQKIWDYIDAEKAKLAIMNSKAIKEQTKNLEDYKEELAEVEGLLKNRTNTRSTGGIFGAIDITDATPQQIEEWEEKQSRILKKIQGTEEFLKDLTGESIVNRLEAQKEIIENNQKLLAKKNEFYAMDLASLKKYIADNKDATDKYVDIAQEVYNSKYTDNNKNDFGKQLKAERDRIDAEQKKILTDTRARVDIETKAYNDRLKEAGIFGVEIKKLTKEQLAERLRLEQEYQTKLQQIALDGENIRFAKAKKDAGIDGDSSKFNEQQKQAFEILQQQHEANIQKIKDESAQKQISSQKQMDDAILALLQESQKQQLAAITANSEAQTLFLQSEYTSGIINYKQYQAELKQIEEDALAERIVAYELYLETLKALESPTEAQIKEIEAGESILAGLKQKLFGNNLKKEEDFERKRKAIRQKYGLNSIKEQYNAELEALKEAHAEGIITEEEFEKAKQDLKLKYAISTAQKVAEIATQASNAIADLMHAEVSNVEAKYDAEIAAAGDNAEEIERLEQEKAQKKLDIEKKYADVQFAVRAAEIIANTAVSIMQAYAQLGPVAGSIAAVLMGITGTAQLAVANAQRKKVKAMRLGGGASGGKTGEIKLKEGFADGGLNEDLTQGGYTGDGGKYQVAGYVPIHSGEYVVASNELRYPDVIDKVRAIERVRSRRTRKNPLPDGFADGGANMPSFPRNSNSGSDNVNNELLVLLKGLTNGDIALQTNYGITELEAQQSRKIETESKFTLE